MKTSQQGIDLIKYFEGVHDGDLTKIGLQPKLCPAGIWTVGYGHALKDSSGFLKGKDGYKKIAEKFPQYANLTEVQAEKLLELDLVRFETFVKSRVNVKLEQHQFDALVSHTYNTGGSTSLFAFINLNDTENIADWWISKYITVGKKILPGLVKRRKIELYLFQTGTLNL